MVANIRVFCDMVEWVGIFFGMCVLGVVAQDALEDCQ